MSLCQEVTTEISIDAIVNAANDTLLGREGNDRAIHEAAGPVLLDECQKINGCEIGECKVTSGYKLPPNVSYFGVKRQK